MLEIFAKKEYYESEETQWSKHFEARIITLNKKYPAIPQLTEYRPIIVTSPLVKYLEGIIMEHLRNYSVKRLNRSQYGFCPQVSID